MGEAGEQLRLRISKYQRTKYIGLNSIVYIIIVILKIVSEK